MGDNMYVFVKDWRQGLEPFDPETEGKRSNTLMATRVLPTEFLDRVSDPLTLTEGNRAWEQQRPEGWAGLPGHDKDIAGTWVSPPTTPSLRFPDINTARGTPMSLVGIAGRKIMDSPDWHSQRANYEGFKYDGFDENKYRLLSQGFPGAQNTTLEDLQNAAMYIDKPDKFDNVTNEQMRGLVNALKTAQIDGEDGNYVDDIDFVERHWAPSVTELPHYARTDYPRVLASEPMDLAMRLLKYDKERVREMLSSGHYPDHVNHMMEVAQPGPDRDLPRPLANLSHQALNMLEHGWYEGDIQDFLDDPNFAFERDEDGKVIWSGKNLGITNEEYAHPELYYHMMEHDLEGQPINFHDITQEKYLREAENTPWELPEPQTFNFLGIESVPSEKTQFSNVFGYGPSDTLAQVEGEKGRGFQDIYTGEPMEIAMRLLKDTNSLYPAGLRLPSGMMANTFYNKHLRGRGATARPEQIGVKTGPVTKNPEGAYPGQHNLQYHSPKHRAIVENTSYLSRGKDFDYGRIPIPEEQDMRPARVIDTEFDEDFFGEDKEAANQFGATPNAYHYRGVNYPKIEETYTPDNMYEMFNQKSEPMEIAMRLLKESAEGDWGFMNWPKNEPHEEYSSEALGNPSPPAGVTHLYPEGESEAWSILPNILPFFRNTQGRLDHRPDEELQTAVSSNLAHENTHEGLHSINEIYGNAAQDEYPADISGNLVELRNKHQQWEKGELPNYGHRKLIEQFTEGMEPEEIAMNEASAQAKRNMQMGDKQNVSGFNINHFDSDGNLEGKGEPMEIAMRLLKGAWINPAGGDNHINQSAYCQYCGEYTYGEIDENGEYICGSCELSQPVFANAGESKDANRADWDAMAESNQRIEDWQQKNASEPMEIGDVLVKERVSPEAKRHKLEYDTKYESSPERVKYREDLNRERRKRGMYGDHSHRDISHTEGNKLTVEDEHSNRSRHFKDKGTLRSDTKKAGIAVKQPKPNDRKPVGVKEVGDYLS